MVEANECVVKRVLAIVERGEIRTRLLFALKEEILFFSLFDATRRISIEVTTFLPH